MNARSGIALLVLVVISLLLAAGITWALERPRPAIRPFPGPSYHAPWYRWEPAPLLHPRSQRDSGRVPRPRHALLTRAAPLWAAGRVLATEIFYFLVGAVIFALFPDRMGRMTRSLRGGSRSLWSALGLGAAVLLLSVVLVLLSGFSAIGLLFLGPLLLLLNVLAVVGFFVSAVAVGQAIRAILGDQAPSWPMDLALGVVTLVILGLIPYLGWLFVGLAVVWGAGAALTTRLGAVEGAQQPSGAEGSGNAA